MSLLEYQKPHVNKLIRSLNIHNIAVDASDTGTGKTYCALYIAKQLNLKPLIICPKSVLTNWKRVASEIDIEPLIVTNYDIIVNNISKKKQDLKLVNIDNGSHLHYCRRKYVKINDNQKSDSDSESETNEQLEIHVLETFEWFIPENSLVIFDEVHRCKSDNSRHYKLLISIKDYLSPRIKCLLLSATIADKPKSFKSIAYLLDWINNPKSYNVWLKTGTSGMSLTQAKLINRTLFPRYGSRIKITKLGNLFPQNSIIPECYDMDNAKQIEQEYENIKIAIEDLRSKRNENKCMFSQITRSRQIVELLKIPSFCEVINDHLDNGSSVVVFVNYTETLERLASIFKTTSVLHGKQNENQRMKIIDDFQSNKTKLIISNIRVGGVGISLHDIHGDHPRVSIISPSWSAQDTIQTLGRIHRANGKTPVIQKFIFCAGTLEEYICAKLREKINDLNMINDGMLNPFLEININEDKTKIAEYLDV